MKNKFTKLASLGLLICGLTVSNMSAQVIFNEDFQSVVLTAGTGDLPAGWMQYNVDGFTPNAGLSFMSTYAWRVRDSDGAGDLSATSISWYNPVNTSNDWMVTPAIIIPAAGTPFLKYRVKAQDPAYPDGYEVRVSTTGNTVADFPGGPLYSEVAAPGGVWTNRSVDLSAYLGQTIYISFRNPSVDMYVLYMDDISVSMLQPNDVTVNSVNLNPFSATSTNNTLGLSVTNNGSNTITSLTVDWNDGASHSSNITGLSIAPGATTVVNHPTAVTYATVVEEAIAVDVTAVNGGADPNTTDNQGNAPFNTVSSLVQHNVLIEEGTGTWCGWCPRGAVAMDYMTTTYPNQFVGIAVHNGDPMTVSAYDAGANLSGFPGCNVERTLLDQSVSQTDFENFFNARKDLVVPASVAVTNTWNASTRAISATVTAHFVTTFAASDYRLAIVLVESDVTGSTSGYNQTNYYSGGTYGPMGGFESLANPVPAANMTYDHVGRYLMGGYAGQSGSVPAAINDLDDVQYVFNYTLPAGYDETQCKLVGLLINNTNGNVINAGEYNLNFNASIEEVSNISMSVYPNPSSDYTNVQINMINPEEVSVFVYDMSGKQVYNQNYGSLAGTQYLTIPLTDLATGQYIVTIATPGKSYSEHLIVK